MPRRCNKPENLLPAFHLETLERRILFSADAALTALDVVPEPQAELVLLRQSETDEAVDGDTVEASHLQASELVIVDAALPDLASLLDDLAHSGYADTQVVVLDAESDALTQISEILAEQRGVTTLHVMSHGSRGVLELAGQSIETLDLLSRADELAQWRVALAPGADVLIYGCEVAADGQGRQFVDTMARLTGADVSASDDLTGSAEKGGDWQLEYRHGNVQSNVALSPELQRDYVGTLVTSTEHSHDVAGVGLQREGQLTLVAVGERSVEPGQEVDTDARSGGQNELDSTRSAISAAPDPTFTSSPVSTIPHAANASKSVADESSTDSVEGKSAELVFVQADLAERDALIADLRQDALKSNRMLTIVLLDTTKDGFEQIDVALAEYSNLDAIHFVTHGSDGMIQLGDSLLAANNLDEHTVDVQDWGRALSDTGDILIYGCDVAANDNGKWLVQQIGALTGADVAASDDTTGHQDRGGDWLLEYRYGELNTDVPLDDDAQASWHGALDIISDLILHNTFDTDASDSSGNSYNGTLTNGAAINFEGGSNQIGDGKLSLNNIDDDDYVDLSAHVANFNNLVEGSIAVWVNEDSVSGYGVVFQASDSGDDDSRIALYVSNDELSFYVKEGTNTQLRLITTSANLNVGSWSHVVVTVDSSGNKMYVNGVQQSVNYIEGTASTNRFFDDVSQLDFMAWGIDKYNGSTFSGHYTGLLDDGRIYDRALSSMDVAELYNYTGNESPTVVMISSSSVSESTDTSSGTSIGTLGSTDANAGDTFTYSVVGGADAGVFSIGGPGSDELILTDGVLDFESQSSYAVTVRTTDSGGLTHDEALSITVTDVNETPTRVAISNSAIAENTDTSGGTSIGTLTSTDVDAGDTFTYSVVGGTDAAVFRIGGAGSDELLLTDGVLDFESQPSYAVTVRTTDSGGLTHDEVLSITVTDVNETPTLVAISDSAIVENTDTSSGSSIGTLSSIDDDAGETLTYSVVGGTDAAVFSIGGAGSDELILTDGLLDFESQSSYAVTIRTTDSGGLTRDEALFIAVTDVIETPTSTALSNSSIAENTDTTGGSSIGTLSSTDVDAGDTFTYSVVGGADAAVFSIGGAGSDELILTDGVLDFETKPSYAVAIRTTDSGGLTHDEALNITITNVNEDPLITSASTANAAENQTAVLTVTSTDVDGGKPSHRISGGADAALFSIDGSSGRLTFTTTPDFESPGDMDADNTYDVTVRVGDGNGGTDTQSIAVTVTDVNEAPVIDNSDVENGGGGNPGSGDLALGLSVFENQNRVIQIPIEDVDADATHIYSLTGGADRGAFNIVANTGVLTFLSPPDHEVKERYDVDVTVTDNGGLSVVQALVINVVDVNESPTPQADTLEASENQQLIIDPVSSLLSNDSDPEQDALTLADFTQPENGTLTLNAQGLLEYLPDEDFVGLDRFEYTVADPGGLRVSTQVWLDVRLFSDPSLAAAQPTEYEADGMMGLYAETPDMTQQSTNPAITSTFEKEADISETGEADESDLANGNSTSDTVITVPLFASVVSGVANEPASGAVQQPPSSRPDGTIISSLLQQLLEHGLSDLDSSFELLEFEQSYSLELRDAILALRGQIDQMLDQTRESGPLATFAPSVVSASLTAGIVTWVLRSGLLLSATITATPLWRPLDPVPILAQSEDEEEPWYENGTTDQSNHSETAANDPDNQDVKHG